MHLEDCSALVGVGTDRAAVNVAGAGLKRMAEEKLSWLF